MDKTTRHFEFKDDKSSKFWEITQAGESVTVRYGKTGTTGQSQVKAFADAAAAGKNAQKLIAEKLGKGYVELGAVAPEAPPTTATPKTPKTASASASNAKLAKPVSAKQDPATVAKDMESTPEQLGKVVDITKDKRQKASVSMEPPAEYQELIRMFDILQKKLAVVWSVGNEEALEFQRVLQSGRWAFNPKSVTKAGKEVDRLGNVILGPLFSSQEFPWPCEGDAPMAPLLQINLGEAGELGNVDLGKGLLQIWLPKNAKPVDRAHCRVIPPEALKPESLEGIPAFKPGDDYFQPVDWALEEGDRGLNEDGFCYQIVGWSKRFTSQVYVGNFTDFALSIPKDLLDEESKMILKTFKSTLKKFKKQWSPSDNHLFGTFWPVQYKWDQRPLPLFCFDGDTEHGTAWGDGSAQVFFERQAEGVRFSFEWACY